MMKKESLKKLALAGILIAVAVAASPLSIPVGASKCFPVQHAVNVLAAVLLGPWYGVGMAFVTSLLRVLMSTGSLLAFPGSMCGALLCGLVYHWTGKRFPTYCAEVFGTAVLGGLLAYPVAYWMLGNRTAALLGYILPFGLSTLGGTVVAALLLAALEKAHALRGAAATSK